VKPWVKYTIIRVGLFIVLFAITYPLFLASKLLTLQYSGVGAAIISAIASLCISYLGFSKVRNEMAIDLAERNARPPVNPDEEAEDELTEDPASTAPETVALESDSPAKTQPE
jgi:Protein of unknown function (DUF4229)